MRTRRSSDLCAHRISYMPICDAHDALPICVRIGNEEYLLKPGMFTNVSVKCKADGTSMPRIDSHALVFEGGKNYVVVVEPDQRLQVKEVDVYKQLSKECYIRSGLSEGDRVLNNNVLLVYNALNAD